MRVNNEIVKFQYAGGPSVAMTFELEEPKVPNGELFEYWVGDFNRADEFTATVEESTYFEVGQKITFGAYGRSAQ